MAKDIISSVRFLAEYGRLTTEAIAVIVQARSTIVKLEAMLGFEETERKCLRRLYKAKR